MTRPSEFDSFNDRLEIRWWSHSIKALKKIADEKNLDFSSYIRGILARELRKEKLEANDCG